MLSPAVWLKLSPRPMLSPAVLLKLSPHAFVPCFLSLSFAGGLIPRMPLDALASVGGKRREGLRSRPVNSPADGRTFAAEMVNTLSRLRQNLQHAQEQQVAETNKHRQPHTFQQGDKVLLSAKNLPITYATDADNHRKALHQKYIGEFELGKQRGENAFEVLLPKSWKILEEFQAANEELQRALKAEEKRKPRKRRKRQA
jgi:hypothetical protein